MGQPKLAYGQTPWDGMSTNDRGALIVELRRALDRAIDLMERLRTQGPDADYWTNPARAGGRTIDACTYAFDNCEGITNAVQAHALSASTLLKIIARLHEACSMAASTLGVHSRMEAASGTFKSIEQRTVCERLDDLLAKARRGYSSEAIYRNFTRQTVDLLFPGVSSLRQGRCVCRSCGTASAGPTVAPSRPCVGGTPGCTGTFRAYDWSDLNRPDLVD